MQFSIPHRSQRSFQLRANRRGKQGGGFSRIVKMHQIREQRIRLNIAANQLAVFVKNIKNTADSLILIPGMIVVILRSFNFVGNADVAFGFLA